MLLNQSSSQAGNWRKPGKHSGGKSGDLRKMLQIRKFDWPLRESGHTIHSVFTFTMFSAIGSLSPTVNKYK